MSDNPNDDCKHCGTTLTPTDGEERVCGKCGRVFDQDGILISLPAPVPEPEPVPAPKRGRKAAAE